MTQSQHPAVAVYAALSKKKRDTEGRHDEESVESQIAKVRARLAQVYGDEVDVLGEFHEVGHSGSTKNRGPELERAIAAITEAASDGRTVELWANTSARFARGTGKRNEAARSGSCSTTCGAAAWRCARSRTTSSSRTRCWSASPARRRRSTRRISASQ